jgi:hypothetical protein
MTTKWRTQAGILRLGNEWVRVLDVVTRGIHEEVGEIESRRGPIFLAAEVWDRIEHVPSAAMTLVRCGEAARARYPARHQRVFWFQVSLGVADIDLFYHVGTASEADGDFVLIGGMGDGLVGEPEFFPSRQDIAFLDMPLPTPDEVRKLDPADARRALASLMKRYVARR